MWDAAVDASALAKRYAPEVGTAAVNHVFAVVPAARMVVADFGIPEVVSVLVRKRNRGDLTAQQFARAWADFTAEVVVPPEPLKLTPTRQQVLAATDLVVAHSINANDAMLLRLALDRAAELRAAGDDLILVASDHRLLAAARAEGLAAFDPETQSAADFDALVGP